MFTRDYFWQPVRARGRSARVTRIHMSRSLCMRNVYNNTPAARCHTVVSPFAAAPLHTLAERATREANEHAKTREQLLSTPQACPSHVRLLSPVRGRVHLTSKSD